MKEPFQDFLFLRRSGYLIWLVMLVMSVVFYQERAFFMDAGFQLFNLINEDSIQIYHYRFVTGLPQILPFLFLKLNLPLWILGLSYSVSYVLIFLLIYHLLVHTLQNVILGWTLILLFTLISYDSFYHMQSEFYLGLAILLLSFGLVLKHPHMKKKWLLPALLPLLFTTGFSHKLSLVFFLFIWLFFLLSKKELRHRRYISLLVIFLIISAVKSIGFTNWYEAAKQADFKQNLELFLPSLHTIPAHLIFLKRCLFYYYLFPILLLVVSFYYLIKGEWIKPALIWSFSAGYLMVYHISDPEAPYRFYSEVSYLPVSIFVSLPFLADIAPDWVNKKGFQLVVTGIILFRLATIAWNHKTFETNLDWIRKKIDDSSIQHTNRFLLQKQHAPMDTILMEWGIPFTSMHLSALKNPDEAKTLLIMPDFTWYAEYLDSTDIFLSPFHKVIRADKLNRRYYNLKEGKYILLEN